MWLAEREKIYNKSDHKKPSQTRSAKNREFISIPWDKSDHGKNLSDFGPINVGRIM